jgi:hypothetical protein
MVAELHDTGIKEQHSADVFADPFNLTDTISINDHTAVERIGRRFYEEKIHVEHEQAHAGDVVTIDVKTGDYAFGVNELEAIQQLLSRKPDAFAWVQLVGKETSPVASLGGVRLTGREAR